MTEFKKTTTTIPLDKFNYIRGKGYKVSELILLGLKAKEDNPQLIARINRLEIYLNRIDEVQRRVDTLTNVIKNLSANITELTQKSI